MFEDLVIYTPMYVSIFWAIVLLFSKYKDNHAGFFLGVVMLAASVLYFSHAVFFARNISLYTIIDPFYIFSTLSVYPLYYWYIKLLTAETSINWVNLRLLLPSLLLALVSFVLYRLMNESEKTGYFHGYLLGQKHMLPDSPVVQLQKLNYIICRVVFAFQVVYFFVKGRLLIKKYHSQIANFYSNLESKSLFWINFIFCCLVFASSMSMIFNLLGRSMFFESRILLLIPSLIFSIMLFFTGYAGYMQNYTVVDLVRDKNLIAAEKPKKHTVGYLEKKLTALFSESAIFRKPDLKITDVSQLLGTNRTYVSELINEKFSCSFVEFVNRYRINEAKKLIIEDPGASIQEVAVQAGFGSIGTFIRVFKNQVGMTPGKYRDNLFVSAGSAHSIGYGVDAVQKTMK
jgi:AraC-like DNA-binding protein